MLSRSHSTRGVVTAPPTHPSTHPCMHATTAKNVERRVSFHPIFHTTIPIITPITTKKMKSLSRESQHHGHEDRSCPSTVALSIFRFAIRVVDSCPCLPLPPMSPSVVAPIDCVLEYAASISSWFWPFSSCTSASG